MMEALAFAFWSVDSATFGRLCNGTKLILTVGRAICVEKMYTTSRGAERAWQHSSGLGILTPPCEASAAELAQLVEQLFRKQQVAGSSPAFGSELHNTSAEVAKRQTRYVQGVVGVTPWEFKSPLRHHEAGL